MKFVFTSLPFHCNRYSVRENLTIESVEQTIEELKLFKAAGGSTIVDVTSIGIRQVRPLFVFQYYYVVL